MILALIRCPFVPEFSPKKSLENLDFQPDFIGRDSDIFGTALTV